jgi:type IV pilus assembly protein PilE
MERFHTLNNTYVGGPCAPSDDALTGYYTFACPTVTATAFSARATAVADQLRDTRCLNLTIDQRDVRTVSGSGSVNDCW